jgi:predicted RNase H-like HicB family nuclease
MKTYVVRAERSGDWWALEVPELPGVFSQARRLDQAEGMARDAIATMLDVAPDSFEVDLLAVLDDETTAVLDDLTRAKEDLTQARQRAVGATQKAVKVLTRRDGLTVRDAGRVLGLSHQRVAQVQKLLVDNGETTNPPQ